MKNKRKLMLLLLFIFLVSSNNIDNVRAEINYSFDEIYQECREEEPKLNSIERKVLKKQIQKRKKYHKNLLDLYNKWFDEKYLDMISKSGVIIDKLMEHYKNN